MPANAAAAVVPAPTAASPPNAAATAAVTAPTMHRLWGDQMEKPVLRRPPAGRQVVPGVTSTVTLG